MMLVPEAFVRATVNREGTAGQQWISEPPAILEELLALRRVGTGAVGQHQRRPIEQLVGRRDIVLTGIAADLCGFDRSPRVDTVAARLARRDLLRANTTEPIPATTITTTPITQTSHIGMEAVYSR